MKELKDRIDILEQTLLSIKNTCQSRGHPEEFDTDLARINCNVVINIVDRVLNIK
jgi:hypothetical protein